MDYQDLGRRVRLLRRQKGYTQEKLAEKVGVSTSFLGHIERGSRAASLETLVELCNALGVGPDYLLQASLNQGPDGYTLPNGLSADDRVRLTKFLYLAEEAVTRDFY